MNQAYQKIQVQLNTLMSERSKLDQQIKDLHKVDEKLKSEMHRTELDILSISALNDPSHDTHRLYHDVNILRHDRQSLNKDKQDLKILTSAAYELDKKISETKFWLKHASNDDIVKQTEAIKRVFR